MWRSAQSRYAATSSPTSVRGPRATPALKAMLPWLTAHVEETRREMGRDFWPYGFEKNQATLSTFLRYSYEQGLSKRLLTPAELFAPETLESFKI